MRPAIVLLLLLPLACGPKDGGDADSGAEAEDGPEPGTTSGPGATSGGPGPTTSSGDGETAEPGSTSGSSTGADLCAAFEDAPTGPSVELSLRNAGSGPVFLFHVNFCEPVAPVEMSGPDSDAPTPWTILSCEFTCGQVLSSGCGCPAFCPVDTVLMIAPGGSYSFAWDGAVYAPVQLPEACDAMGCGPSCMQVQQAAAGDYTLRARGATSAINCENPDMCTCTPNAEGWCDVLASGIGAELREAEAVLAYPNTTSLELVFTDP